MDYSTGKPNFVPRVNCDWLDVTFPTDSPLWDEAVDFFASLRAISLRLNDSALEFRLPNAEWGNFHLQSSNRGWSRLSASGGSCEALRGLSAFSEYLGLIGCHPHTVTRLDACLDVFTPAPPIISSLVSQYPPDSLVYLTRKGVSPDYILKPMVGGGYSGTFYAPALRKKAKVMARVYDKQLERFQRAGIEAGPWTRYEGVFRKGIGVTLRDAYDPAPLFWHYMSPAIISAPPGVTPWSPFEGDTWGPGRVDVDPYHRLRRRVEDSVDLDNLISLADSLPSGGRMDLFRLLRNRLGLREISLG